jgi:23S rRNA pseudouridine1911/1915/1917 synthase
MSEKRPQATRWVEHTITAEQAGQSVEEILTDTLEISRRMIQKLTRRKGIQLNRKPAFLAKKVRVGDVVRAALSYEEESGLEPMQMDLNIVYEDQDMLVLNKPPFLLVHPTTPDQTGTLSHGIAYHYQQIGLHAKVRPVHRIDRDTSGLLVVAKTSFAHQHLDRQLRERDLKREYLAFVSGVVSEQSGTIDAPIGKDKRNPNLRAVRPQAGEFALTRYEVVETYANATLVHLELDTGRTHQIRVHMTHLGHPLLGDRQYGRVGLNLIKRQALHASRLSLSHPTTGEPMTFEAPFPDDLVALQTRLQAMSVEDTEQ